MTTAHVTAVSLLYRIETHLAALALRQVRLAEAVELVVSLHGMDAADWSHLAETLRAFAFESSAARLDVCDVRQVLRRSI